MVIAPLFVGSAHVVNVFGEQRPSPPLPDTRGRARHSANQPTSGEGRRSAATFLPQRRGGLLPVQTPRHELRELDPRIPLPRIIIAPRANARPSKLASRGERRRRRAPVIARGKRNLQVSSARVGIFATREEGRQSRWWWWWWLAHRRLLC